MLALTNATLAITHTHHHPSLSSTASFLPSPLPLLHCLIAHIAHSHQLENTASDRSDPSFHLPTIFLNSHVGLPPTLQVIALICLPSWDKNRNLNSNLLCFNCMSYVKSSTWLIFKIYQFTSVLSVAQRPHSHNHCHLCISMAHSRSVHFIPNGPEVIV